MKTDVIYTGVDHKNNWFWNRYFYGGGNNRYYTFQLAINLLQQYVTKPIIIETGCQRQEEDVGAGMSTSIFAEYIYRYGGKLITVDNSREHLRRAALYCEKWKAPAENAADITFVCSDSVSFLRDYRGQCDLVYLDSLDYPIGEDADNIIKQLAAQDHCLNEFMSIEGALNERSIVLLDDNDFPGGGKPAKTKNYLLNHGWICLLDLQSTLWVRRGMTPCRII